MGSVRSLFSTGFEKVKEAKTKQEKEMEERSNHIWRLFLTKDKDEARIRFLTTEPINFYEHNLRDGNKFTTHICVGEDCPYCEAGERASFKSAWLVYDMRDLSYTDKRGNEVKREKGAVRMLVFGVKVSSHVNRLYSKYGLDNQIFTLVREGSGQTTSYYFERESTKKKIDVELIKSLLPEKFKKIYDGSEESAMEILRDALEAEVEKTEEKHSEKSRRYRDEDDDDEDFEKKRKSKFVRDDDEEDDADEEDEPVKKSGKPKGFKFFKKSR